MTPGIAACQAIMVIRCGRREPLEILKRDLDEEAAAQSHREYSVTRGSSGCAEVQHWHAVEE